MVSLLENLTGPQNKTVKLQNFTIKTNTVADCYVLSIKNNIFQVKNIVNIKSTNKIALIGKVFQRQKPFYDTPISSTVFNVYEVDCLSKHLTFLFLDEIKKKNAFRERWHTNSCAYNSFS